MNANLLFMLVATLATLPLIAAPPANSDNLPLVSPKVKTIAAFKNGLGFVFKTAQVELRDGWARMEELPPAALGTLWIGTTATKSSVTEVITSRRRTTSQTNAITQAELLAANVGKKAKITFSTGPDAQTVEGTILATPEDRRGNQPIDPALTASGWRPPAEPMRGEIVLLHVPVNGSIVSLNKSTIQAVEFGDDAILEAKIGKEVTEARIHVSDNPAAAELTLSYLEKGIVWSPSYRVNIKDDKKAEVLLEAILANDVEDLENVDVSFVVGYPNFLYADLLSPLTLQQTVGQFIQNLVGYRPGTERGNRFDNVMGQSIAYNRAGFEAGPGEAGYSVTQPLPGEGNEDLYFYRKSGVTLKKGDRARYVVFNASVPYEHVYQWEVPDSMNVDERGYRREQPDRGDADPQVWHVLCLENSSKQPWTTAPAFTVNGLLPVAQDVLNYAPPGGKSRLKLTVATDVRAGQSQVETARKTVNVAGRTFDEVSVAGKLQIKNYKSREIRVAIRKTIVGDVQGANQGKVSKVVQKLTSVNPTSEIEWEFDLAPGKERELTYEYKALIYR